MDKLYFIFDEEGNFVSQNYYERIPVGGVDVEENPITENFIKIKYNWQTQEYYEGATAEEIAEANKLVVPISVTRRQLLLALAYFGINSTQIDTLISLLDEPEKTFALISWKEAATFDRDNEMLNQMANAMEISQEQLDQLFINASTL